MKEETEPTPATVYRQEQKETFLDELHRAGEQAFDAGVSTWQVLRVVEGMIEGLKEQKEWIGGNPEDIEGLNLDKDPTGFYSSRMELYHKEFPGGIIEPALMSLTSESIRGKIPGDATID